MAGERLWFERFHVTAFFDTNRPKMNKIPIPIFDRILNICRDPGFRFHDLDLKDDFQGGHSKEEFLASLNWMYRKEENEGVYKLVSPSHKNNEDLQVMRYFLAQLEEFDWGQPPYHFSAIRGDILATVGRLLVPSKRVIEKNSDLLALHFLSAFHLTEVAGDFYHGRRRTHCFMTVDSTASGHLCLSLGFYLRENGEWNAVELPYPKYSVS